MIDNKWLREENKVNYEQVKKRQLGRIQDYKQVFSTDQGKRVLMHLIRSNYVLSACYVDKDPHSSLVREGQRMAILNILTVLDIDEHELYKMIKQGEESAT